MNFIIKLLFPVVEVERDDGVNNITINANRYGDDVGGAGGGGGAAGGGDGEGGEGRGRLANLREVLSSRDRQGSIGMVGATGIGSGRMSGGTVPQTRSFFSGSRVLDGTSHIETVAHARRSVDGDDIAVLAVGGGRSYRESEAILQGDSSNLSSLRASTTLRSQPPIYRRTGGMSSIDAGAATSENVGSERMRDGIDSSTLSRYSSWFRTKNTSRENWASPSGGQHSDSSSIGVEKKVS